jgi:hypothetical protein
LAAILLPAWYFGHITPTVSGGVPGVLVFGCALWASSFVIQLVTGAVVAAAMIRADGGDPTVRAALAVAWSRRWQLAAWALAATIVGLVLARLQRFGVAGFAARLVAGLGWAAATIFAVPLVISEGTMPVATARRSARMVQQHFGTAFRCQIRLAAPWVAVMVVTMLAVVPGVIVMVMGLEGHNAAMALTGGVITAVAGTAFFFAAVMSAALSAYLVAMLFRYVTGRPIPGISPDELPPLLAAT